MREGEKKQTKEKQPKQTNKKITPRKIQGKKNPKSNCIFSAIAASDCQRNDERTLTTHYYMKVQALHL